MGYLAQDPYIPKHAQLLNACSDLFLSQDLERVDLIDNTISGEVPQVTCGLISSARKLTT
jgi:hypothetical protein